MTLSATTIGFIGLGLMGRPMALNLQRAGAQLIIHNRSRRIVDELSGAGMESANSPRQVAERAKTVILMVTDTRAVEDVLLGRDGAVPGLEPGSLVIDMGTTAVAQTRRFAERVMTAGADYVDAPVSGGQLGAEAGNLTVMVGARTGVFERARPLLEPLAGSITHVGDIGAGQVAKAANQIIVGLTIGAVAEAIALARRSGVDPANVREALMGGFAASRILELHGRRMIDQSFEPGGRATTQRKDLAEALELARELNLELPATALTLELYDRLIEQGDGGLDQSALIRVIDSS